MFYQMPSTSVSATNNQCLCPGSNENSPSRPLWFYWLCAEMHLFENQPSVRSQRVSWEEEVPVWLVMKESNLCLALPDTAPPTSLPLGGSSTLKKRAPPPPSGHKRALSDPPSPVLQGPACKGECSNMHTHTNTHLSTHAAVGFHSGSEFTPPPGHRAGRYEGLQQQMRY